MKTVVITGSGRRIGRNLALLFAQNGWNVGINYCNSEVEAEHTFEDVSALTQKVSIARFDVRDLKQIEEGMKHISDEIGVPDVLINNAGVFPERADFSEISSQDWDYAMNINARGAFLCSQVFADMKQGQNGKIINIASLGGLEIWKQRITYNVSKAAVIQLTKALARELAPQIAVNAVCPGTVIVPDEPPKKEIDVSKIPMQRYGTVNEIFEAVSFFAECSNYITGQILSVDGGNHLVK